MSRGRGTVLFCIQEKPQNQFVLAGIHKPQKVIDALWAGSGIAKIQQGWTALGHVFEITDFHQPYVQTKASLLWAVANETTPITTSITTPIQQEIVAFLVEKPNATQKEIAGAIGGLTRDGVKYHLKILKQNSIIQRVGPSRGGHWLVKRFD